MRTSKCNRGRRGRPLPKDVTPQQQRSLWMARIRGKDTGPELVVRRAAHRLGYRFRLHRKDLPGTPDLVFPGRRKAIFVHGCFWHAHEGCPAATLPKTRRDFWTAKFEANRERDARKEAALGDLGWDVLVLWQCEVKDVARLDASLKAFLR